jgi:hypothetical protein
VAVAAVAAHFILKILLDARTLYLKNLTFLGCAFHDDWDVTQLLFPY